jgi:hypothetical protein
MRDTTTPIGRCHSLGIVVSADGLKGSLWGAFFFEIAANQELLVLQGIPWHFKRILNPGANTLI